MLHAPRSIPALFFDQVRRFGNRSFLYAKRGGTWAPFTWTELAGQVRATALGLLASGLRPGDRTAILSENRPEWFVVDLATQCAGGADAPVYTTNTPEQCAYVVRDSEAGVVFVSGQELLDKLAAVPDQMPDLKLVVTMDPTSHEKIGDAEVITLGDLQGRGAEGADPKELEARIERLGPDDLVTLIYTSGTTGDPKGVMLTQGNLCSNVAAATAAMPIGPDDIFLSFLPLSHSFERMAGYLIPLQVGAHVYYAESVAKLLDNLVEVRPTVMASVPRIYEKVYSKFMAQAESATGLKRKIIDFAIATGMEASGRIQRGQDVGGILALKYRLAKKLVFSKLSDKLGGRIRFFISGGAPLSRDIAEFFHAAGMLVLEGYGLTETSPVLTVNRPDAYRFGTVGQLLSNVEIKIAEDGEILARGPNIMKGYYNKPEATAEVLLEGGWFATGDIGEFDPDGFLRITDRKKDLIKTAGGKYVAPQAIQNALKLQAHIEQACVIGDERPYCVALIVPDFLELEAWAAAEGLDTTDHEALIETPEVRALLAKEVEKVNAGLGRWETLKYFHVLAEPFSQENKMLTPTMKVRRKFVTRAFADEIEGLYKRGRSHKKS